MLDLIVRGGEVFDGTGDSGFRADVGVEHGTITAIGDLSHVSAAIDLSAEGSIVTPGFIDIHTHYDAQVFWDGSLSPSDAHGVTTALFGNCGVGFAPVRPSDRSLLVDLMAGVEDIAPDVLEAGIGWNWESFPEYLDALAALHLVMDVGVHVPHAPLRLYVMGPNRVFDTRPSRRDLEQIRELVTGSIDAGALGVSSSRTTTHRSLAGDPVPGTFAEDAELRAIFEGLNQAGRGVFEFVPLGAGGERPGAQLREVELLGRLSAEHDVAVSMTLLQNNQDSDEWRHVLEAIATQNHAGARLCAQIAVKPFGMLLSLHTSNPFRRRPSYRTLDSLSVDRVAERLREPAFRRLLLEESASSANPNAESFPMDYNYVFPLEDLTYEPGEHQSLEARARARGCTAEELALDMLAEGDGETMLLRTLLGYSDHTLEPILSMLRDSNTVVSLSDAGAHYRLSCDVGTTTYLLKYWARDRHPGIDLAHAVKALTSEPARLYGLTDRGTVAVGQRADLNIIDHQQLELLEPRYVSDLPADGGRLVQHARGYRATIVGGVVVRLDDEPTGQQPGRLIRGSR